MKHYFPTTTNLLLVFFCIPTLAFSQPKVELAVDTTAPETVNIVTRNVEDPAGHSCCVTPPPLQINFFLDKGNVNFSATSGSSLPLWFDFGPMALDSNLDFTGESRSTVAGFGQILTILTGSITAEDNIEAEIKIGAAGGLPQALPITFGLDIKPAFKYAFVAAPEAELNLSLDLTAITIGNILLEDKEPAPASGLDLFISMRVDYDDSEADWWIVMQDNAPDAETELYHYQIAVGAWVPGLSPSHQGPLVNIPEPFKLLEGFVPPSNDYVIVFGVDKEKNGILDFFSLSAIGARYRTGI